MTKVYCQIANSVTPKLLSLSVNNASIKVTATFDALGKDKIVEKEFTISDFPLADKDWQSYFINFDSEGNDINLPVATNPLTFGEKIKRQDYALKHSMTPVLVVFAPYAISKVGFDGLSLIARVGSEESFTCNTDFVVGSLDNNSDIRSETFKPITFSSDSYDVNEDGVVELIINHPGTSASSLDVYLESTGGYMPINRVTLNPDGASLRFMALGMKAGETCKVKAGFYNYPAVATCNITVQ